MKVMHQNSLLINNVSNVTNPMKISCNIDNIFEYFQESKNQQDFLTEKNLIPTLFDIYPQTEVEFKNLKTTLKDDKKCEDYFRKLGFEELKNVYGLDGDFDENIISRVFKFSHDEVEKMNPKMIKVLEFMIQPAINNRFYKMFINPKTNEGIILDFEERKEFNIDEISIKQISFNNDDNMISNTLTLSNDEFGVGINQEHAGDAYYEHRTGTVEAAYYKNGMMEVSILSNNEQITEKLVDDIHDQINNRFLGIIPIKAKNLDFLINRIDYGSCVKRALEQYENKYNKTLISDILEEFGLSKEKRKALVNNLLDKLQRYKLRDEIDIKPFIEDFNKELDAQFEKFGFIDTKKLDEIFKKMQNYDVKTPDKPNGKLDKDLTQGHLGDCGFVATMKCIANTPKAREIVEKSIKLNSDGSVTVNFAGNGDTVTISKEDINDCFVKGDRDVGILESAIGEIERLEGISPEIISKILFKNSKYEWFEDGITEKILKDFNNRDKMYFLSHGFSDDYDTPTVTVYSENNEPIHLYSGHYYSVLGSDDKFVYIANPHETSKKLAIPKDFAIEYFDCECISFN